MLRSVVARAPRPAAAFSPAFGSLAADTLAARICSVAAKKDGEGNFLDKLKGATPRTAHAVHAHAGRYHGASLRHAAGPQAAKDMFNPEMMKKYSRLEGAEPAAGAAADESVLHGDGKVVVRCREPRRLSPGRVGRALQPGRRAAGAELTTPSRRTQSGKYAQEQMATLYADMALAGRRPHRQRAWTAGQGCERPALCVPKEPFVCWR